MIGLIELNKKGQIFSLDFLISLIAVTLAIGLLLQMSELKAYNEKEEAAWQKLKQLGETASRLLVNNPDIICDVDNGASDFVISNCIDSTKTINRAALGLPLDIGFSVKSHGPVPAIDESSGARGVDADYYSVKRTVVVNNSQVSKANYLNQTFTEGPYEIVLAVWKE